MVRLIKRHVFMTGTGTFNSKHKNTKTVPTTVPCMGQISNTFYILFFLTNVLHENTLKKQFQPLKYQTINIPVTAVNSVFDWCICTPKFLASVSLIVSGSLFNMLFKYFSILDF